MFRVLAFCGQCVSGWSEFELVAEVTGQTYLLSRFCLRDKKMLLGSPFCDGSVHDAGRVCGCVTVGPRVP